MRMIDCLTGDEWDVGLDELSVGDVFYDEGSVYVRSQTLNGHPRIVTGMGLICSFEEIERAFKMNGRVPRLARWQGVWAHDCV